MTSLTSYLTQTHSLRGVAISLVVAALTFEPILFLHEGCHYTFLKLFSRRSPIMKWKIFSAYVVLPPETTISRNKALWCAISPFVLTAIVLGILVMAPNQILKITCTLIAIIQIGACSGDLMFKLVVTSAPRLHTIRINW